MKRVFGVLFVLALGMTSQAQNYIDIAGSWAGWERVSVTVTAEGQTETDSQEGTGSMTISQTGKWVSYNAQAVNPFGSGTYYIRRNGTVAGNRATFTGQAMVVPNTVSGVSVSQNTITIVCTVTGNVMRVRSTGIVSGTYQGVAFTGYINSTGVFTGWREPTPPELLTQPEGQIIVQGTPAVFQVQASGIGMQYQWKKNGINIPGATNSAYRILAAQQSHAGTYWVMVRNFDGAVMSEPASLEVVPSPFTTLMGTYHGLYYAPEDVRMGSSGYLRLTLSRLGGYSGRLVSGLQTNTFTGQFDGEGRSVKTITRTGKPELHLAMFLDPQSGNEEITGGVWCAAWTAELSAVRAITNATSGQTPFRGRYTAVLPAGEDGGGPPTYDTGTIGNGYATVKVDAAGTVVLSGKLADNQPISQAVGISRAGAWPVYIPLYAGKGALAGWIQFGGPSTEPEWLAWLRPTNRLAQCYSKGFYRTVWPEGSSYQWTSPNPAVRGTNGLVVFTGGNLPAPLTNNFRIAGNRIFNTSGRPMAMSLNPTNGVFSGWFKYPGQNRTNRFEGSLLQDQNYGSGFFMGTNLSGCVWFIPDPGTAAIPVKAAD